MFVVVVRGNVDTQSCLFGGNVDTQSCLSVKELRDLIRPFCEKHNLDPKKVVLDNDQITPGEAMKAAFELQTKQQLEQLV
jgi:hypothetical protein